jgi:hypothetical protein
MHMKVAVGFFGITRSLKYTINSINENIFDVLKTNNIEYDVYIHTYNLTNYKNIRTGEKVNDDQIDNTEYNLLNPDFIEIDKQETIKQKLNLLLYRSHVDPWGTNYNSVDNFILAQYSKLKLTKMIEEKNIKYDYVLFMRPDCLYINKLPIDSFLLVDDSSVIIPNFHLYGRIPFNDRFCICNINTYKIYGGVFNVLLDISKSQPLHSETIIGELLTKKCLNIKKINFMFRRIRFDGSSPDKF